VERSIVDKSVTVGHSAHVGRFPEDQGALGITTIGKNTQIPAGMKIGHSAIIGTDVRSQDFKRDNVDDGGKIARRTIPLTEAH
jgi:hypothetical protein